MMNDEPLFPSIKHSISTFIEDEEGSIPAQKVAMIGTMVVVLTVMLAREAFAAHGSHRSHSSHKSHASTSYIRSHGNHGSHSSHDSHESHGSHTSHSNTASHSNSNYSAAGDNGAVAAPSASSISGVVEPANPNPFQGIDIKKLLDGIGFDADSSSTIDAPDVIGVPGPASDAMSSISTIWVPPSTPSVQ